MQDYDEWGHELDKHGDRVLKNSLATIPLSPNREIWSNFTWGKKRPGTEEKVNYISVCGPIIAVALIRVANDNIDDEFMAWGWKYLVLTSWEDPIVDMSDAFFTAEDAYEDAERFVRRGYIWDGGDGHFHRDVHSPFPPSS